MLCTLDIGVDNIPSTKCYSCNVFCIRYAGFICYGCTATVHEECIDKQ